MKKRYGETIDYKKNRANKIARNKTRRKAFKMRYVSGNQNSLAKTNPEIKPPREIRLLSGNISFTRDRFSFKAPKTISFKSNADETIEFISIVASVFMSKSQNIELQLDFDQTEYIDIGPLSIIDVIIDGGLEYIRKSGRKCRVYGFNPVKEEANLIFSYSGLPKTLGNFEGPNLGIITLDPLVNSNDANTETHKIINYYNDCLKRGGYELNPKGQTFFFELINEIVDNAIIHCGNKRPTYITSGFYNPFSSKGQLSIVSIGKTIYETLNSSGTMDNIKSTIEELVNIHEGLHYSTFSEENVWTICALQSGVSCKRNDEDRDRGTGTVKFIEAFITLGQSSKEREKPIMTMLSGNTHILFDGKYKMAEKTLGNKTIAFNDSNDLRQKPDTNYVKITKNKFPGVVINIEFYIDREYLEKFKKEK